MSCIKRNIIANFAGQGWSALMQLAFVPLYLKFLGIEAYGLIGFYIMLQAMLQVLDLGLSRTMNREMARCSDRPEKAEEARDLARTLEAGYWLIGIVIGAGVLAAAPWIASHWIKARAIPVSDVTQTVMMIGVLVALQWPLSIYQGGLMGLQRQVLLNGLKIGMVTLSGGGAVLILWSVSGTITAFFAWQIIVNTIYVILVTRCFWRSLPASRRTPRFNLLMLKSIWRFATGMSGITVSALVLTQLDKLILSKLLTLEMFGYYMLASVIGNGLNVFIGPIFNAVFPRFSVLVAARDEKGLRDLYHSGTQLMAALTLPVAAVLVLFPADVLLLWTGNAETARIAAPIASVLVIGTALNGLMNLPYALQLAHGWTSIGLRINILLIIVLVPGIFVATTQYGAVGAAAMWVVLNTIYMLIGVPLTHARLLEGETWRWICEDVGIPLVGALSVAVIGRWLVSSSMAPLALLGTLVAVLIAALATAALAAPKIRAQLVIMLPKSRELV